MAKCFYLVFFYATLTLGGIMEKELNKKEITDDNISYCSNCGSKLTNEQDVCLSCGMFVNAKRKRKKNKAKDTASFSLVEVIVLVLITALLVASASGLIVYKNYDKFNNEYKGINNDNLEEIEKAYKQILDRYYNKVDEKELVNSAIEGMYDYLGDPYSSYLDEYTTKELKERLDGEFFGLGIEFTNNENGHQIVNVFEGGPAYNAGLLKDDIIIKIDGIDVTGLSSSDVATMIKYSDVSKITITVKRGEEELTKDITLSKVSIPSVSSEVKEGVGYINISTFASNTATQVSKSLNDLESLGIKGLIIDLRGNGGGLLTSAEDIANLFIEKGKNIYALQSGSSIKYYKDTTKESRDYKIAVLIDGASASASEILAAALKESYGATLIGSKSYGKGTVQETSDLSTGAMVKYTTGYWLTPKGNNINGVGITPDIETEDGNEIMAKAIEAVK